MTATVSRPTWDDYAVAWASLHGGYDPRRAAPVVRGWLRLAYVCGRGLARLGVAPTAVTVLGLLLCLAVPVSAGRGPAGLLTAALLTVLAGVADAVDGAVAVVADRATRLGFVYDSAADRVGEVAWLAAFWLIGAPGPLVVAVGAVSWLHEYVRARAGTAGMRQIGTVTMGERPTRVVVAALGLALAGVSALIRPELAAGTVTFATMVWLLLAGSGLAQLFAAVRRALR
jgi:phosphatidylglycerophosphate synthase